MPNQLKHEHREVSFQEHIFKLFGYYEIITDYLP